MEPSLFPLASLGFNLNLVPSSLMTGGFSASLPGRHWLGQEEEPCAPALADPGLCKQPAQGVKPLWVTGA